MVLKIKWGYLFLSLCALVAVWGTVKLGTAGVQTSAEPELTPLPVVMYHQITKNIARAGEYCVTLNELEGDMEYLKEKGYTTIDIEQLLDYIYNNEPLPEKPVMLTFDDGYETVYSYLLPLLEKHNMCAVASVVGAYADLFTQLDDHTLIYSYMNWAVHSSLN